MKKTVMMLRQWLITAFVNLVSGSGLEEMELERLQIVDAIKGYKSKSVSYSRSSCKYLNMLQFPALTKQKTLLPSSYRPSLKSTPAVRHRLVR